MVAKYGDGAGTLAVESIAGPVGIGIGIEGGGKSSVGSGFDITIGAGVDTGVAFGKGAGVLTIWRVGVVGSNGFRAGSVFTMTVSVFVTTGFGAGTITTSVWLVVGSPSGLLSRSHRLVGFADTTSARISPPQTVMPAGTTFCVSGPEA